MSYANPQAIGMWMNTKGNGMSNILELLFIEPLRFLFKIAMCSLILLTVICACLVVAYIIKVTAEEISDGILADKKKDL